MKAKKFLREIFDLLKEGQSIKIYRVDERPSMHKTGQLDNLLIDLYKGDEIIGTYQLCPNNGDLENADLKIIYTMMKWAE